tara:strand:+ start:383 stop:637 length:255 start_codon:yes stop_codon:yes gene_type:complete
LVEISKKIKYINHKEINMSKDWQRGSTFMNKDVKVEKELGVGKDGYQTGGKTIEATDPMTSQVVDVKGTKRMRADKKPVKATWY